MKAHYKPIPLAVANSFKTVLQENNQEFDYPWHYHPEYELTYILSSHGVRYVGNSIENFSNEDLVLLGPNLPHCWINTGEQQQSASAIVVYWKEDFLGPQWRNIPEYEAINQLLELSKNGVMFEKAVALQVKKKCFQLLQLPPFEKMILLLQILQELAQSKQFHLLCQQGFSYDLNHTNNERINTVYKYIRKHYQQKITLADLAEQVNMSEEYFSRFFSKIMKKSFFEFLNEYKINIACKLLIETDMQVAEICYASGYESFAFFYRQFKKFKKYPPIAYRLHYQKIAPEMIQHG